MIAQSPRLKNIQRKTVVPNVEFQDNRKFGRSNIYICNCLPCLDGQPSKLRAAGRDEPHPAELLYPGVNGSALYWRTISYSGGIAVIRFNLLLQVGLYLNSIHYDINLPNPLDRSGD